ncbi:MAG: DUF1513 domain-containing protein [Rhodospirillales bacterium]|nr:DUF1513 domain-containing protein [Rhodospirillales bacterium]MBO6788283.1 DUF1513 domain-containing protein [Rhodospirillales bacterium]
MTIDRRTFNLSLIALGLGALAPRAARADATRGFLSTGFDALRNRHLVSRIGDGLDIVWDLALPARGHGTAVRPASDEGLVVARRPGTYALTFGLEDGEARHRIPQAPGRHFYGHGVYSADGNTLWMTENDFDNGEGVIGVYDAASGYARRGEFKSGGIGPHQLLQMPDGRTLAVANGGILTHPDRGREKLNLDTMSPSLAYLDGFTGRMINQVFFDDTRRQKLSIRHMVVLPDGRVAVGCQDQAKDGTNLPLVYIHDRAAGDRLTALEIPTDMLDRFNGYCGSVACGGDGKTLAVSSPRGGLVGFWRLPGGTWQGHIDLADGCGLAPGANGGIAASSGTGTVGYWDKAAVPAGTAKHPFRRWDNHMTAIGA